MVNTFVVHQDFQLCALFLDDRRLGKQRVEAKQIIDAVIALQEGDATAGWRNHPATRSWLNHLDALKLYFNAMVSEWVKRGYKNNYQLYDLPSTIEQPYWIDCSSVHYSHMAQLVQKDSSYYSVEQLSTRLPATLLDYFKQRPLEYSSYGYIWPYKHTREQLLMLNVSELAEPYAERPICTGAYKSGASCRNKAIVAGLYCRLHTPVDYTVVKCTATLKSGAACRNKAKYGEFCGVHRARLG